MPSLVAPRWTVSYIILEITLNVWENGVMPEYTFNFSDPMLHHFSGTTMLL